MFFLTKICQVFWKINDRKEKVLGQKEEGREHKNIDDAQKIKLKDDSLRHKNLSRNNQNEEQ